jgi:hypothetical protein
MHWNIQAEFSEVQGYNHIWTCDEQKSFKCMVEIENQK